jgi:hypothetical protein
MNAWMVGVHGPAAAPHRVTDADHGGHVAAGQDLLVLAGHRQIVGLGMKRAERGTRRLRHAHSSDRRRQGLAIIGVIAQHALTRETMDDTGADFWLRQSVPVLFVLMGFNAARSSLRRPAPTLAEAYGARYWRGRYRRILLPLLIISAVALVAGSATGRLHVGRSRSSATCRCRARACTGSRSCSRSR